MTWLIVFIAIIFFIEGIMSIVMNRQIRLVISASINDIPMRFMGLIMALMGIGMVNAADECRLTQPVVVLGSILFSYGLLVLILPERYTRSLLRLFLKLPVWGYRMWGLLMISIGLLLLWCR
ncbi:MAG: hypothetical protein GF384_08135 [Elusimicrobia bacterium]|nr:hypothetical protein [Elusimicrobiota bacterium]MBD3412601.1 hypothetical protein [Elusimicrobiota bacterium]